MECLDANVVQDLMSGALDEAMRGDVLGHLDACDDCRELVGVTAQITLQDHLTDTAPYPDQLVAPRKPADDIALDATMAPGLEETRDSLPAIGATRRPPARLIPPRSVREIDDAGPFGRYVLDEKLGAGAMGVVWRAHDPKLGRMVALKLLRRYDPALMDRLVREARSMAQVSHPNVVAVFDVGESEGSAFIAMELVEGRSLRQWQSDQTHKISAIVEAYVAAGRGLAAAHGAGIVHRDFKADNVLVGNDGRIRVTDFGLAAAKASDSGTRHKIDDVNLTTSGSVLGTPAYMAPEQFTGGNVDPRTDQFNFCVSLYEALYGERPFEGAKYDELSDNVTNGRIRPAPAGSEVSGGMRAILVRGLAAKPGDRFPSMEQLLVELARDRARPWRRTAWIATAAAAALALGLVADWTVRGRVAAQIAESFELTGNQVNKTVVRDENELELGSKVAYSEPAMREVAGHHDQADFGLGTPEADHEELEKLHNTLASMEWKGLATEARAVVDYKGRVLFTSYAPQIWNTDMRAVPAVKRALDTGRGSSIILTSYADPMFAPSKVFGSAPPKGLVLMHLQTLALGNDTTGANETRAILVQFMDIARFVNDLRLDPRTLLAVIAPNNDVVADPGLDDTLIHAAPRDGIAQVVHGDSEYQVLQFPIIDHDKHEIGDVVMARKLDGVLVLFPHARGVFALATLLALGLAVATMLKARQLTGARAA